jgi:hypothetical protein
MKTSSRTEASNEACWGVVAHIYKLSTWEDEASLGYISEDTKDQGFCSMVECLPNMCKAVGSILSTLKEIGKKKKAV